MCPSWSTDNRPSGRFSRASLVRVDRSPGSDRGRLHLGVPFGANVPRVQRGIEAQLSKPLARRVLERNSCRYLWPCAVRSAHVFLRSTPFRAARRLLIVGQLNPPRGHCLAISQSPCPALRSFPEAREVQVAARRPPPQADRLVDLRHDAETAKAELSLTMFKSDAC